jgi:hypothetical protein
MVTDAVKTIAKHCHLRVQAEENLVCWQHRNRQVPLQQDGAIT